MSVTKYDAVLKIPAIPSPKFLEIERFSLDEKYNWGWQGYAIISSATPDNGQVYSDFNMLDGVLKSGLTPGKAVVLTLAKRDDSLQVVRNWPSVVTSLKPFLSESKNKKTCLVELVDPITFLSPSIIYGSYKNCSIGELLGGVLSMATGFVGQPSLNPKLAGEAIKRVEIFQDSIRPALQNIPYAIAGGHKLSDWLTLIFGQVGARYVLDGHESADGGIVVDISDSVIKGEAIDMEVSSEEQLASEGGGNPLNSITETSAYVISTDSLASRSLRAVLMDDPSHGPFRRMGSGGGIESVIRDPDIGVSDSFFRASLRTRRESLEMLGLALGSRQTQCRPGQVVKLNRSYLGTDEWQVCESNHAYADKKYVNASSLLRNTIPWVPMPPRSEAIIITGVVDSNTTGAGDDEDVSFEENELVTRDHIGRVQVKFLPGNKSINNVASLLDAIDSDGDGLITDDDFTDKELASFKSEDNIPYLEVALQEYESGAYDDPYPLKRDDELTKAELARRNKIYEKRLSAERYKQHKQSSLDMDKDGYVTALDAFYETDEYDKISEYLVDDDSKTRLNRELSQQDSNGSYQDSTFMGRVVTTGNGELDAENVKNTEDLIEGLKITDDENQEYIDSLQKRLEAAQKTADNARKKVDTVTHRARDIEAMFDTWDSGSHFAYVHNEDGTLKGSEQGRVGHRYGNDPLTRYLWKEELEMARTTIVKRQKAYENAQVALEDLEIAREKAQASAEATREKQAELEAGLENPIDTEKVSEIAGAHANYKMADRQAKNQVTKMDPVLLRVLAPAAGNVNGFIANPRQGDACRVILYNPLLAEIIGFCYNSAHPVNNDARRASISAFAEHDGDNKWTGIMLRPVGQVDGEVEQITE